MALGTGASPVSNRHNFLVFFFFFFFCFVDIMIISYLISIHLFTKFVHFSLLSTYSLIYCINHYIS